MEFKIPSKAKTLTMVLMIVGIISFGLGVMMEYSESHHNGEHFGQRFLANMLVNSLFFFGIAMGAMFFLALQYATETGWYASIKRIIEAVTGFIPYGAAILVTTLMAITIMDGAHIYVWMDDANVVGDPILTKKSAYLNEIFFWIRTVVYLTVYLIYWNGFRKRSLEEDKVGGTDIHFKNYRRGAAFLVFFAVFSSTSAWDWIMSIDAHWYSTLFGWYVFGGMWCSAMITLVCLTLYLKKQGYLANVNENHIHDLGKWTFATSFLWSYLWFSQFMLIWYANIPEEVTYHQLRIEEYKLMYFAMFFINFAFPMLLLMSRDAKRHAGVLTFVGLIIFGGHWVDTYIMVMGGSLGKSAFIGFMEIGLAVLFLGAFIRILLTNLTKAPLTPVNHPFLDESIHHEF